MTNYKKNGKVFRITWSIFNQANTDLLTVGELQEKGKVFRITWSILDQANTDLLTVDELQEKWKGFPNHVKHTRSSEYRPVNSWRTTRKMVRFSESRETYSIKWLKEKLKDCYSDHLCFAEIKGRKNVLCFKNMANYIINEK